MLRSVMLLCVLRRGQSDVVWFAASTLCRYDVKKGFSFLESGCYLFYKWMCMWGAVTFV